MWVTWRAAGATDCRPIEAIATRPGRGGLLLEHLLQSAMFPCQLVQGQVQLQHIHPWFAEQTEVPLIGIFLNQIAKFRDPGPTRTS